MKHYMYFFICIFSLNIIAEQPSAPTWEEVFDKFLAALFGSNQNHNETPDMEKIQRIAADRLAHYLQPGMHQEPLRTSIERHIEHHAPRIANQFAKLQIAGTANIRAYQYPATTAEKKLEEFVKSVALEYAQKEVAQQAEQTIRQFHLHNDHKKQIISMIKDELGDRFRNHLLNNQPLTATLTQLSSLVANRIHMLQDVVVENNQPQLHQHSNEIYEIYPKVEGERNHIFFAKFQQGKIYRQQDCCVCFEDFKDLNNKRVTLFCGHSICPQCLYRLMYEYNKNSCPLCRETIYNDEFPAWYIQQHC